MMMIVIVHLNREFMRKNLLLALGFEPSAFLFGSGCHGIPFFTGVLISPIDHMPFCQPLTSVGTM